MEPEPAGDRKSPPPRPPAPPTLADPPPGFGGTSPWQLQELIERVLEDAWISRHYALSSTGEGSRRRGDWRLDFRLRDGRTLDVVQDIGSTAVEVRLPTTGRWVWPTEDDDARGDVVELIVAIREGRVKPRRRWLLERRARVVDESGVPIARLDRRYQRDHSAGGCEKQS